MKRVVEISKSRDGRKREVVVQHFVPRADGTMFNDQPKSGTCSSETVHQLRVGDNWKPEV